ncbi:hypothetical protein BVY01_02575 [bacterium I07]|nr:hypothetical protein BVY01_02575 [bacterium I07]
MSDYSPAISRKVARKLRQTIKREWNLKSHTHLSLNDLARRINPVVTGWINYYGRFCRSELHSVLNYVNMALVKWAMRKYKRLRRRKTRADKWLKGVARRSPQLFSHWQYQSWMIRAV